MSLDDIFKSIREVLPPDDNERTRRLRQDLKRLKEEMESGSGMSDTELLNAIRKKFELECNSEFLDDADWLMNALFFTNNPVDMANIPLAWESYQIAQDGFIGFRYDVYPILEALGRWYFDHRDDPGREQKVMVTRALAVYEFLMQQVSGREADPEYENILAGYGPTMVYLYKGIQDFERAKYYAQLVEREFLANRLEEDEYLPVMKEYEQILIEEKRTPIPNEAHDLHKINRTLWQTISARDRRIEQLEEENNRLSEQIAESRNPTFLEDARKRLKDEFGVIWERLHDKTRKHLELGDAYSDSPLLDELPEIAPVEFFQAVKSEILARLFKPHGRLDPKILMDLDTNPVRLLIRYDNKACPLTVLNDLDAAFVKAAGTRNVLFRWDREKLYLLNAHRDKAIHIESKGAYTQADLKSLLLAMAENKWLVGFLRRLHAQGGNQVRVDKRYGARHRSPLQCVL